MATLDPVALAPRFEGFGYAFARRAVHRAAQPRAQAVDAAYMVGVVVRH